MWVDAEQPCRDPECDGTAEPEQDGDFSYYACSRCGYEFGYQQVRRDAGSCQLGVPETVRRRADTTPAPTFLGTVGRRRT